MAIFDEWERLSARIHGLLKATELAGTLFEKNNDSLGAMVDLGKTAAVIFSDLASFRTRLGPSSREVSTRIEAAESRTRAFLSEGVATSQDMRQIYIRSALVTLASLEAEVTYLLSDHQSNIQSRTERAFEHLQRSIVVDGQLGDRWRRAWEAGEVECEKLGAVHLLSHGIWAFKVDSKGARTDLVYQEPMHDLQTASRSAEGLVLTEWKKLAIGANAERLFASARAQTRSYASGALAGTELTRVRYAVLVSSDSNSVPDDITEGDFTYRHINIAVSPRTPSRRKIT
jgi:hypothetical protein